uniref:Uncharacterized protein n=1 Tax=Arundo donax TaxID=35708 RepID=A0A0A9FYK2_ARUDO
MEGKPNSVKGGNRNIGNYLPLLYIGNYYLQINLYDAGQLKIKLTSVIYKMLEGVV